MPEWWYSARTWSRLRDSGEVSGTVGMFGHVRGDARDPDRQAGDPPESAMRAARPAPIRCFSPVLREAHH
jgi:hypothetical protein